MIKLISVLLALSIVVPFTAYFVSGKKHGKKCLFGNIIGFFSVMLVTVVALFSGNIALAEGADIASAADGMKYLSAALATGLATVGTGIAVSAAASAALGALSENEKIMGKALIFVAMAEGIALYGLLVSFTILAG